MIYIFVLLIVLLIGNSIAKYYDESDKKNPFFVDYFRDRYGVTIPFGVLIGVCIFLMLSGVVVYIDSIGEIAEMEAFQDNTLFAYEYTVDKSEDITIYAIKGAEEDMSTLFKTGDLAYFRLAESVNSNLVELREAIETYNKNLYSYRRYNAFWFTDTFFAEVPDRLKPIKLK